MSVPNLRLLAIEKIIIHDVPKHKKNDFSQELFLSERESKISTDLKLFFKNKIINALESERAFRICYDDSTVSPAPTYLAKIISTPTDFINHTQEITKHIYKIQTGINPAGIMVFFLASLEKKNVIGLMKLERDTGAQRLPNLKTHSIDAEQVKNLMLTEKTKLYKAAFFLTKNSFKVEYDGVVMDYQLNPSSSKIFADFFVVDFLGCNVYENPRVATKNFFDITKKFILQLDDPIKKTKYTQDLFSYLQKNSTIINPREFADDYLKTAKERDDYKFLFKSNNIPFSQLKKDTYYVESKMKKISIEFENGINIIALNGEVKDNVRLEKLDNGMHKAEII